VTQLVHRVDVAEVRLDKAVKLDNGWIRVPAVIGRVGVFEYHTADGQVVREYRPPEEVLHADSLSSFEGVPLTNDHPPVRLDSTNARAYSVGSVGSVRANGTQLEAMVLITDSVAAAMALAGKRQLSPGYSVQLDPTPGVTPDGEKYDAVQRRIRGNHVAEVQDGRQGPTVELRMDSGGAIALALKSHSHKETTMADPKDNKDAKVIKATIGDSDYELSPAEAKAAKKAIKDAKAAAKSGSRGDSDDDADDDEPAPRGDKSDAETRGRLEALEAQRKKDEAEREQERKDFALRVDARVELVSRARSVIGEEFKADGKSDADIMEAVVLHVDASAKDRLEVAKKDSASWPGYVKGRYEVAVAQAKSRKDTGEQLLDAAARATTTDKNDADPASAAKAKSEAERRDAWKQPKSRAA
jgi:uncharacterized protein